MWGSGFLASTVLSMALLAKAVQTLPLGTAYAIWTGIGAIGTVLIGIFVFKEPWRKKKRNVRSYSRKSKHLNRK